MAAAAATPGGYGGVPQSVGAEFKDADALKAGARKKLTAEKPAPKKKGKPRGRSSAAAMVRDADRRLRG